MGYDENGKDLSDLRKELVMEHKLLARKPIGNPRRVWRQDNFTLAVDTPSVLGLTPPSALTKQKTRRAVKTALDAGFDLLGCLWAHSETAMDIVRAAEAYGGKVLFQDLLRFGGMGDNPPHCQKNDYEGAIRDTAQWKSIAGYIMYDEPILDEHLAETRRMIDYCEKVRPELLPYVVANPNGHPRCHWKNNAYASYIKKFIEVIDPAQMDFDAYPIGAKAEYNNGEQLDNSSFWSGLEVVRRAAAESQIPFWFYYQGQRFPWHKGQYVFTPAMERAMAFSGVLHGAKALSCYIEFDGYVDPKTGGRGKFFDAQKRLNDDLHNLGHTLMALNCQRVIHDEGLAPDHPAMEGYRTPLAESELLDAEKRLPRRISISEHIDAYGNQYLMVLNRDYVNEANVSLTLKAPCHAYEVSPADGEQYFRYENTSALPLNIAPGDLALYRLQPASEAPFTLEYYLDK